MITSQPCSHLRTPRKSFPLVPAYVSVDEYFCPWEIAHGGTDTSIPNAPTAGTRLGNACCYNELKNRVSSRFLLPHLEVEDIWWILLTLLMWTTPSSTYFWFWILSSLSYKIDRFDTSCLHSAIGPFDEKRREAAELKLLNGPISIKRVWF